MLQAYPHPCPDGAALHRVSVDMASLGPVLGLSLMQGGWKRAILDLSQG
jgi:hypothetical protein